jgi:antitoxin ParD1/3/4
MLRRSKELCTEVCASGIAVRSQCSPIWSAATPLRGHVAHFAYTGPRPSTLDHVINRALRRAIGHRGKWCTRVAPPTTLGMAKFAIPRYPGGMSTMNVSLPDELRSYVDEQVRRGAYGSTSEYVRDLIRRDKDRQQLRLALLDGASSNPGPIADASYFTALRSRIRTSD